MMFDKITDEEKLVAYANVFTSNKWEELKQINLYDVGMFLKDLAILQKKNQKQKKLVDKIKKELEDSDINSTSYNYILDLIKEYEENNETYIYINNINNSFFTDY